MTIARHIGQYRILRKIGAGGMGLVFLGEHTLLGRRAAIKTLLPQMSANREIVERFFNEARATSAIADPGVIQVFDFGYHVDGTAYIVMELLEGEALSARIERLGKLPPGDALRIARQIAGSLAAAHACDIVHRDLKPENIFLVADAEAQGGERTKILDFGICKMGAGDPSLTQSGAMIGTPVYMSPEQCRGAGGVDHRSDIYAFGCLVFHMLTGRPPFVGDVSGELIVAHLEEAPPAPSRYVGALPPAVDALVLRCLAKAPEERFQSMTELHHELGDLAVGLAAAVEPPPPGTAAVPLGQGFRSLYDGNFANPGGTSSVTSRPLPWLRYAPTPRTLPESDDPADDSVIRAPRRATTRAVLACVLVVGVVIGLVGTSSVIYSSERGAEAADRRTARPTEAATGAPVALMPALAAGATQSAVPDHREGAAADATDRDPDAEPPSEASDEPPHRQPEAPRERTAVAPPPTRPTTELTRRRPAPRSTAPPVLPAIASAPPQTAASVAPPPAAPAPIAPPPSLLPASAAGPPIASPPQTSPNPPTLPTPATEDLYDTR